MNCRVTPGNLDSLYPIRRDPRSRLLWGSVFVLPQWLESWWREFGAGAEQNVCIVEEDGDVIGVAPLMVRDGTASFIGSTDVCDYMDFVVAPGKEGDWDR